MLKVDLHLHTSEDPADNIVHDARTLVDRAVEKGFDAIAITLHDRQFSDQRVFDYARERGLVLLPGIERTIAGKHALLINFAHGTEQVDTFSDLAVLRQRSNGIVVAPHPFFPHRTCLRSLLDTHAALFDAVEWSYFWTSGINFNARAARWAEAHGKPMVGNSDLHELKQLGRTYSLVFAERSAEAICEGIRKGRVSVQTEPVPALELASIVRGMTGRGRKTAQPLTAGVPSQTVATTRS